MLKVNPKATPGIKIPVTEKYFVTVDTLHSVDHYILAAAVELTLDEFEDAVRKWAEGVGLVYGVLAN